MSGGCDTKFPALVAVVGLGNVLLGDDGFGPTVIELLSAGWDFPAEVELVDGGTPGLHLVTCVHGREVLVLIDTVTGPGAPGELRCYRGEDLQQLPILSRVSPHDPAVLEALAITALAGSAPRTVLVVGVIPSSLAMETRLSPAVRAACPRAAALVVEELTRVSAVPRPRREATAPDAWWMRHSTQNP